MNYNLSQRELAELVGVSQTAVYKWEKSDIKIRKRYIDKLTSVLNIDNEPRVIKSQNIQG
jgi:transcriptional regulator with XRE-family HTH domain